MAAPSQAQNPPQRVLRAISGTRDRHPVLQKEPLTINTDTNGQRLSGQSFSQSRQNRYSTQTEAPTVSTQSPFASPTASSFRGDGLAPRPPSFGYAEGDSNKDFLDRRRRRKSENKEQDFDEIPPPAAPDAPRPAPPISYKLPYNNSASSSFQAAARSKSTRRPEGPISPNDTSKAYYREIGEEPGNSNKRANKGKGVDGRDEGARGGSERPVGPQPYQRRDSNSEAEAQRRREWAPDKSPLQRLERTLDSITKEEKRARVEEAELIAREAKAGRGGDRANQNSVRFSNRPVGKARGSNSPLEPQTLPDAGLVRSLSNKQKDQLQRSGTVESRRPVPTSGPAPGETSRGFDYHPQQGSNYRQMPEPGSVPPPGRSTGERSVIPAAVGAIGAAGVAAAGLSRSGSNKLRKEPPGESQFNRRQPAEKQLEEVAEFRRPSVAGARRQVGAGANLSNATTISSRPQASKDKVLPLLPNVTHDFIRGLDDNSDDDIDVIPIRRNSSRKIQQLTGESAPFSQQQPNGTNSESFGRSTTLRQPGIPRLVTVDAAKLEMPSTINNEDSLAPGVYVPSRRLDEWKKGGAVLLDGAMLDLNQAERTNSEKDKTWWEAGSTGRRRRSSTKQRRAEAYDGEYDDNNGMGPQVHFPHPANKCKGCISSRADARWLFDLWSAFKSPHQERGKSLRTAQVESLKQHTKSYLLCSISHISSNRTNTSKPYSLTCAMRPVRICIYIAPTRFKPPLFLKCGPLLRYCGLRKERRLGHFAPGVPRPQREVWRGSVMIVSEDSKSSYELAPTLRLFVQPIDLLPPPPAHVDGEIGGLAPEYVDPIAGLPKIGRDGRTLYIRPVDLVEEMRDLSMEESNEGIFENRRTPLDASADSSKPTVQKPQYDGEKAGKYQEIRGFRLHAEHGVTFWKFNIEIELREKQQRVAYRINRGPATGFWVPGRDQAMNIMFHSCNGFTLGVDSHKFSGPDPMWRDVLNTHQTQPFHVMLGGGDQIYNDAVEEETTLFKQWTEVKDHHQKERMPFTPELQDELELFYLTRYSVWFSQGLFGLVVSQIPTINIFDDHDIIDGWGSYPDSYMKSPVMSGLGAVAFKYYMLFQHQSSIDEGEETEPSWILGAQPGPYIPELSRSIFTHLGRSVAFLGLDCRTERRHNEILSPETYDKVLDRLEKDIIKGETRHLIIMLGNPLAYPRMIWLENILTSRLMDPLKALGRVGIFGKGLLNRLDGGVEIQDDLDDHWTAKHHRDERHFLVEELQNLAAEKSVRITFLSGNVHLAAVGQFYSHPKLKVPKDHDHRYMLNVISSGIVNAPPPDSIADLLNRRTKVHHLDAETHEDMIPLFLLDVDGKPRSNKRLLNRRNWGSIRIYDPELSPPPTPDGSFERSRSPAAKRGNLFRRLSVSRGPRYLPDGSNTDASRPPLSSTNFFGRRPSFSRRASTDSQSPGVLTRTLSLTRKDFLPGTLFRRNSKKRGPDDGGINGYGADSDDDVQYNQRHAPSGIRGGGGEDDEGFTPSMPKPLGRTSSRLVEEMRTPVAQPGPDLAKSKFHRTPTFQSEKQRKSGGGEINLEGGLDICLNVEVSSNDPAGITTPYRLLVPRLWYEEKEGHQGEAARNVQNGLKRWVSLSRNRNTGGSLIKKSSITPSVENV